jgi:hypothetical protein
MVIKPLLLLWRWQQEAWSSWQMDNFVFVSSQGMVSFKQMDSDMHELLLSSVKEWIGEAVHRFSNSGWLDLQGAISSGLNQDNYETVSRWSENAWVGSVAYEKLGDDWPLMTFWIRTIRYESSPTVHHEYPPLLDRKIENSARAKLGREMEIKFRCKRLCVDFLRWFRISKLPAVAKAGWRSSGVRLRTMT